MKEKINKIIESKIVIILLAILLISLITVAGTYAWFTWTSSDNPTVTLTIGKLADVIFDTGPDISVSNLSPVFYYDEGASTTFSINNRDTSGDTLHYNVKINITSIHTALRSQSFKYALVTGGTKIAEGSFNGKSNGEYIDVITEVMPQGTTNFTMYFYIDANIENSTSIMGKAFSGTIEISCPEG